jgi:hypothetical protein
MFPRVSEITSLLGIDRFYYPPDDPNICALSAGYVALEITDTYATFPCLASGRHGEKQVGKPLSRDHSDLLGPHNQYSM